MNSQCKPEFGVSQLFSISPLYNGYEKGRCRPTRIAVSSMQYVSPLTTGRAAGRALSSLLGLFIALNDYVMSAHGEAERHSFRSDSRDLGRHESAYAIYGAEVAKRELANGIRRLDGIRRGSEDRVRSVERNFERKTSLSAGAPSYSSHSRLKTCPYECIGMTSS